MVGVALLLFVTPVGADLLRQIGLGDASPANDHAAVIAQGVAPMPEGDLVLRVVADAASTDNVESADPRRAVGFLLAGGDTIAVNDADTVSQMNLSTGEAAFVPAGSRLRTVGLAFDPVPFYRLELVPTDAEAPAQGDLVYATSPFPAHDGPRDPNLVRDVLAQGKESTLTDTGQQGLFLVTAGAVQIGVVGAPESLMQGAGEASTFRAS